MLILMRSNLRRERGQTAILVVLVLIGAMVLNLLLMLSTDYHANFDRWHETLNAEDVLLIVEGSSLQVREDIGEVLAGSDDVSSYEMREGVSLLVTIPYNEGTIYNAMIVLPADTTDEWTVGRIEMTAQAGGDVSEGMYYPMIYESQNLALGKDAEIEINGEKKVIRTAGFFNSIMAGSHNCGIIMLLAGDALYSELQQIGMPATVASVRLNDRAQSVAVRGELTQALFDKFPGASIAGTDYIRNRQARYVAQAITAAILAAAVCFVLIVAMTVAASNAATHVQQSMPELGILKSIGYTGKSLIAALILQYTAVVLPASVAGAALAYTVFPGLSALMTAQTGIPYEVHFLPGPFFASCAVCTGTVAAAVWIAARRIYRIEPITALRSGIETHNFRHNPLPLDRTRLPLTAALGFKECRNALRRNITICVTMAALTLLIVFAAIMTTNMLIDEDPLLDLIGVERADVMFTVAADDEEQLLRIFDSDDRVEEYYLFHQETELGEPGGSDLSAVIFDDADDLHNQEIIYEGRLPVYENEVAVGAKHATERGLTVGDTIDLGTNENVRPYLITGLSQGTNYLGDEAYLTREGYERIEELNDITYYISLRNVFSDTQSDLDAVDTFIDDVQAKLADTPGSGSNQIRWQDAVMSVYIVAMRVIVSVLAVLTVLLTVLVMVLLTRTVVNTRLHEYGILKAIGFTTKNLIAQTIMSFLPVLLAAETAGLIVWSLLANSIVSLFMRGLGTMRCNFEVPVGLIMMLGALLLAFSLGIIALMACRIRRIDPVTLMTEE